MPPTEDHKNVIRIIDRDKIQSHYTFASRSSRGPAAGAASAGREPQAAAVARRVAR